MGSSMCHYCLVVGTEVFCPGFENYTWMSTLHELPLAWLRRRHPSLMKGRAPPKLLNSNSHPPPFLSTIYTTEVSECACACYLYIIIMMENKRLQVFNSLATEWWPCKVQMAFATFLNCMKWSILNTLYSAIYHIINYLYDDSIGQANLFNCLYLIHPHPQLSPPGTSMQDSLLMLSIKCTCILMLRSYNTENVSCTSESISL